MDVQGAVTHRSRPVAVRPDYAVIFIDGERGDDGRVGFKGRDCLLRVPQRPPGLPFFCGASLEDAERLAAAQTAPVLMFMHVNGPDLTGRPAEKRLVDLAATITGRGLFVWFTGLASIDRDVFQQFTDVIGPRGIRWNVLTCAQRPLPQRLGGIVLPMTLENVTAADIEELRSAALIPSLLTLAAAANGDQLVPGTNPFADFQRVKARTPYRYLSPGERAFVESSLADLDVQKIDRPTKSSPSGWLRYVWRTRAECRAVDAEAQGFAQQELATLRRYLDEAQDRDSRMRAHCRCGVRQL